MGTFPEPGPPVVVAGFAVPTRGQGDRSPAPAWARGPERAENDRAMGFAGMARSYRKIQRFRHIRGLGSRHHPPFPPKWPAPAVGAGRAREIIPSDVSGLFAGMAAPTETSGAFGMFAGMARSYRKIERFRDILGHGLRHHPPFPPRCPPPAVGAGRARDGACPHVLLPRRWSSRRSARARTSLH